MRLSSLKPKLQNDAVSFDCPIHGHDVDACIMNGRIYVPFAPPLDGSEPLPGLRWARSGSTVEDLSLSPSVNCHGENENGHVQDWHGYVTNGEVSTC